MLKLNKVDSLPEIVRAGRHSEELTMIIGALKESVKYGTVYSLEGITAGNAYNSMQQRIRAQAKKLGFKTVVRFDSTKGSLFFKATELVSIKTPITVVNNNVAVSAKEIAGIKSKVKTK